MPSPPEPDQPALAVENHALREEVRSLRAARQEASLLANATPRRSHAQERFQAVFEHSPLGHKIIGADLTIRQANSAAAALLGLDSPADLLGRRIRDFAHPAHHDDWADLQEALWTHRTPFFALETRLQRPDGSDLWCRMTSVLIPDEDGELGFTTLEDITARKRLEAQALTHAATQYDKLAVVNEELGVANEELLATNADLSLVNSELDTFIYAASHDLRTPITNLQGLLDALADHLPPDRPDAGVAPLLDMMRESVARFRATLERLVDFGAARHDAGGRRENVALVAALDAVRQEVAPLLAATGGRLDVAVAGDPHLWFSPQHLHSVLLNLVGNALKYRHPERAPVVRVRGYRSATQLVVRVQDNGRGLTAEQQSQLFGLFRRFHPDVEGTGVGLYLVKKILAHAGGTVTVESQPGHGATFTLVFPI